MLSSSSFFFKKKKLLLVLLCIIDLGLILGDGFGTVKVWLSCVCIFSFQEFMLYCLGLRGMEMVGDHGC